MEVFWREIRRGQRLVLKIEDEEEEIGGVRETKNGFDAFAKTYGYDPSRAEKGLPSMDDGKEFVEFHRPWEMYEGA